MSEGPRRKGRKSRRSTRETSSQKKALASLDQLDPAETPTPTPPTQSPPASGRSHLPLVPIVAGVLGLAVLTAVGTWMMGGGGKRVSPAGEEVETVADDTITEPPVRTDANPTAGSEAKVVESGKPEEPADGDEPIKPADENEPVVAEVTTPSIVDAPMSGGPTPSLDGIDLGGLDEALFESLEPEELTEVSRLPGDWSQLRALALAPDGERLYLGLADGTVVCRDLAGDREVWRSPNEEAAAESDDTPPERLHTLLVASDGSSVVVGGPEAITVFSATDGTRRPPSPVESAVTILVPASGDTFLSGHVDGTLVRRRIGTGEELGRTTIGTPVTAAGVFGETLAVGDWRGRVHLLDAETFEPTVDARAVHESPIHSLVGDERSVIVAANDGSINTFTLPEGEVQDQLEIRSPRPLLRIGQRVLSGRQDGTLELWGTDDETITHRLVGHEAPVHGLAWSAPEGTVVSAGWDGTVRFWKVPR